VRDTPVATGLNSHPVANQRVPEADASGWPGNDGKRIQTREVLPPERGVTLRHAFEFSVEIFPILKQLHILFWVPMA
jgi:hypothetical protein